MRVCVGGSFELIHKGHEKLLEKAFSIGDEIFIGLASESLANSLKGRKPAPIDKRRASLEEYLRAKGWTNYRIVEIDQRFGTASSDPSFDAIVVSQETRSIAEEINEERVKRGLEPLEVHTVPMVLAEDCNRISSTRILNGEIDKEGRLLRPLRVNVGTSNPLKVEAVRAVLARIFDEVEVHGKEVASGVPDQPFEDDAIKGAIRRAKTSLHDADLGVGIEAGLFWIEEAKTHFDVQYCAIVDRMDRVTIGHGPGFTYPPTVLKDATSGLTVSEAMEKLTGIAEIGRKQGAIGYLSKGLMDRKKLTEEAVLMAMIPRVRKELYFQE